ncbi:hypothetical protein N0V86_007517 [Didymella sp. IMI 355093]|nr:hypothetical protein N0V86_007517 [Didymella sp. IMI 355093]
MLPFKLGRGISYHTNKYGLACDNVAPYEVVTASGRIVTTSPRSYPDLYWALRGGGNNFGIVTLFNYETLTQGPMWGGSRRYNASEIPKLIDAFVDTTKAAEEDGEAAHALSISTYAGARIASTLLEYTSPINTANPPAILRNYLSIPPTRDTEHLFAAAADFPSKLVSVSIQAFSVPTLRAMQKNGGNALGLKPEDGPLFHVLLYSAWNSSSDDAAMMTAAKSFIDTTRAMGKERGLNSDYIYMPYASGYQEVVTSYGAENQRKLKTVATRYDPQGVFQKLQPGGFKLDGAPFRREE